MTEVFYPEHEARPPRTLVNQFGEILYPVTRSAAYEPMNGTQYLVLDDYRQRLGNNIFDRARQMIINGHEFHQDRNMVFIRSHSNPNIIRGGIIRQMYQTVLFDRGRISCTCEYFNRNRDCKHIVFTAMRGLFQ